MRAIKSNSLPVNELVSGPARRPAHRVMVKHHPRASSGDAARTFVQPHGNSFVGEVVRVHLIRPEQRRPKIHPQIFRPALILDHLGGFLKRRARALRQRRQILRRDVEILLRIVLLEKRLPQEINDVVALLWRHPQLRWHLVRSLPDGFVEAEGIAAVLESLLPKRAGRRQRAGFLGRAVTGDADCRVKFFPTHQALCIPFLNERRVSHRFRGGLAHDGIHQSNSRHQQHHSPTETHDISLKSLLRFCHLFPFDEHRLVFIIGSETSGGGERVCFQFVDG